MSGDVSHTCLLISTFNIEPLAGFLANDPAFPSLCVTCAPYGQLMQTLADPGAPCWQGRPDLTVVWTQPEAAIPSFAGLMAHEDVPAETLDQEVDEFCSWLLACQERTRALLVPTWSLPTGYRGLGMLDMRGQVGVSRRLLEMNLRLGERLDSAPGVFVVNAAKWVEAAGRFAFSYKLYYMAKVPFGNQVFKEAVRDIKSALSGLVGQARKLVIVDLDDTLWGGIVGEVGWQGLVLGGHDPAGEAFVDFQNALKALTRRGILLGIVSKNEEAVALDAIQSNPEMVLRSDDFAGWRINWQDKAQNVVDLVGELNLGLPSVVFLDDNPAERSRVREALPEVLVPDLPDDPMERKGLLVGLRCFDTPAVSEEDRRRVKAYVTERQRTQLRQSVGSVEEWLKSLELRVRVEPLGEGILQRTAQLLNKTNQMNMSTRRMTEGELASWAARENHQVWAFRVADRFGDSGLTGIGSIEIESGAARIVDFILSCRVMGRRIEEAMLHTLIRAARARGAAMVRAEYRPTAKNKPCLDFLTRSGLNRAESGDVFVWDQKRDYPLPEHVTLEEAEPE